jgi:protein-S-isoprenylcysteine O-methyltransferase Ste14
MSFVFVQIVLMAALGFAVLGGWGPRLVPGTAVPLTAGAVLWAVSLILMIAAFVSLGRSYHITPSPHGRAELVTSGVYRRLRHPMYTAGVGMCAGFFLLRPTLPVAVLSLALILFFLFKVVPAEKLLLARYPEYREYKAKTRGVLLLRGLP